MRAKKLTKKKLIILIVSVILAAALCGVGLYLLLCGKEPPKFTVNGTVTVGSSPISGFTVDSSYGPTVTDENGRYSFTGVVGSITVDFSDDVYYFGGISRTFTDKATFDADGREYRTVSGVVKNGDTPVSSVNILIKAENGSFFTQSNSLGEFSVGKLIGKVEVEAVDSEGEKLFTKTLKETESEVVINATSTFSVEFIYMDGIETASFEYSLGGDTQTATDKKLDFGDVSYGTEFRLYSDVYGFSTSEIAVLEENAVKTVYVYKKYEVKGRVVCGNKPLSGVEVYINGTGESEFATTAPEAVFAARETIVSVYATKVSGAAATVTNENGEYTLSGLFGKNTISILAEGFKCEDVFTDFETPTADFYPLKRVCGTVSFEEGGLEDIAVKCGDSVSTTDEFGNFEIYCAFGDELTFERDGYVIDGGGTVSEDTDVIEAVSEKYYDASIKFEGEQLPFSVEITVGGERITVEGGYIRLENIYGEKTLIVLLENYSLDYPGTFDRFNNNVTVKAVKLFNLSGTSKSGELNVPAEIFVNGEKVATANDGEFELCGVKKGDTVIASCGGYDAFSKTLDGTEEFLEINFVYSVTVSAKVGEKTVRNYSVLCNGENFGEAEKTFTLNNLSGRAEIELRKDHYSFEDLSVEISGEYEIQAKYSVAVNVMKSGEPCEGWKIILIDAEGDENDDGNKTEAFTDSYGNVAFTDLDSEYVMFAEYKSGVVFKPDYYEISGGGLYTFSDSGYGFSGKVTVGEKGLAGVKLTAGDKITYTDEDGYYEFKMITSDCVLKIEKTGYEFDLSGLPLSGDYDGETLNVAASYTVTGKVQSGGVSIKDVSVTVGGIKAVTGEDGTFTVKGITETESAVIFAKDGFIIENSIVYGYTVINKTAYADVTFKIVSGESTVSGVKITVNGKETERFELGDVVSFEKAGYDIGDYTVESGGEIVIDSVYEVTGKIMNGSDLLKGAEIFVNGEKRAVSGDGTFKIEGLSGTNVLSFAVDGYRIRDIEVCEPCEVIATTSYDVKITVLSGELPVSGVKATVGGETAETDENGVAFFENLSGRNGIALEKSGYAFSGEARVSGAAELIYEATYTVSGKVSGVGKTLSGVSVTNGMRTVYTDAKGGYSFMGLKGANTLTFEFKGYKSLSIEVHGAKTEDILMEFYIEVTFEGLDDFSGISVFYNDTETFTDNENSLVLGYFGEKVTVTFSKDGYKFTPARLVAEGYTSVSVTVQEVYKVTGTIKTRGGVPVAGMKITGGDAFTFTDGDGNYVLDGLTGEIQISGRFEGCTHSLEFAGDTFSTAGTYSYLVSDTDYAWALFEYNYEVRLKAEVGTNKNGVVYEIYGIGSVDAGPGGMQTAGATKRRDGYGNIITENLNYGDVKYGVDPKVSLLSYFSASDSKVQYTQINDVTLNGGVPSADYTGASFTNTDDDGYMGVYGNSVKGILDYNVNEVTVKSISNVTKSGNTFTVKMVLDESIGATWSGYEKQMEKFSGVNVTGFNKIEITFTFNEKGHVVHHFVDEAYTINKVINVTTSSKLNFDYYYPDSLDLRGFKTDNASIQKMLNKA